MADEHDETFWINACLHILFCQKKGLECEKCAGIKTAIAEDKSQVPFDYVYIP